MYLNDAQEKMISGEKGEAVQKSMEILVGLGEIYGAEKLIPIKSAHLSGVSIRTAGDAGLNFVREMADKGAKSAVPTTLNPAGADLENWRSLGVPEDFAKKQTDLINAYKDIGARPTCSCVPYLTDNKPSFGEHIAWAESSAVIYSNSVIGSRTNREGAPSALASSITGLTPAHGYHLDENRLGTVKIEPNPEILSKNQTFPYSVLGYWIGEQFPDSVPVIDNLNPKKDQLKALGAGMATSGAIALYHMPGVTPETRKNHEVCKTHETVHFDDEEFERVVNKLDQTSDPDLICIGCPHASIREIRELSKKTPKRETWICLGRDIKKNPEMEKIIPLLEEKKIKLVCDTCMVVSPLSDMGYSSIGVNSAKAAHYAPTLAGVKVHFAPTEELLS